MVRSTTLAFVSCQSFADGYFTPYDDVRLYRRFTWGQMATFNVVDGRQYRSDQPQTCLKRDPSGYCVENLEPSRTMLSAGQLHWLQEDLATTKARWNILAQQTAFAPGGGRRLARYRIVGTVRQPTSPCHTLATFVVANGRPGAQLAGTAAGQSAGA